MKVVKNIRHILVVCRLPGDCTEIIHYAASIAKNSNSQLFVLTVIYNPFGVKGLSLPRPSLQKDLDDLVETTTTEIRRIISTEKLRGINIDHLIKEGKPEKVIDSIVRERNIDLVVLPAHRQNRLEHFLSGLSGDYNKALLRNMPTSVLFFKQEPAAVEEEEEQEEEWGAGLKKAG